MYTNGQIIINATSEDLIRDGHSIVESFEEVNETTWYKLNEDQKAFKRANHDSDITEVIACQLGKYTFDKAKEVKIKEINEADKKASVFYLDGTPLWINQQLRTTLKGLTIPALEQKGIETTELWYEEDGKAPLCIPDVPIPLLKIVLVELEVFSKQVYGHTSTLEVAVSKAETQEELDAIELTGYPEPLHFTLNEHKDDI